MAETKKKNTKKSSERSSSASKGSASEKEAVGQLNFFLREKKPYDENSVYNLLMPYVCFFGAVLSLFAFIFSGSMNILGEIALILEGLAGHGAWVLPLYLAIQSFLWKIDAPKGHIKVKAACAFFFAIFLGSFIHMFVMEDFNAEYEASGKVKNFVAWLYENGRELKCGGVLGGGLCTLLYGIGGKICAGLVSSVGAVMFGLFLFGWTINDVLSYSKLRAKELYYDAAELHRQRKEQNRIDLENRRIAREELEAEKNTRKKISVDTPLDGDTSEMSVLKSENDSNCSSSRKKAATGNPLDVPIDDDGVSISAESTLGDSHVTDVFTGSGATNATASTALNAEKAIDGLENPMKIEPCGDIPTASADTVPFPDDGEDDEGLGIYTDSHTFEEARTAKHSYTPKVCDGESSDDDVPPFDIDGEKNKSDDIGGVSFENLFADGATIAGAGTAVDSSAIVSGTENAEVRDYSAAEEAGLEDDAIDAGVESIAVGEKPKPSYSFPPISLLEEDPNPATFEINDELRGTSVKLVETLASFGVRTKIMNICCGPAVTRYELKPDVGVKVRAIQNLADDIALHLSASSVRIEAPIPGKDAVGIEIPNKTRATVYIRNLIENPAFSELKSRVSMCLGMDVAGSPMYMDMAKMPHLLIAGATGMGKSVCINSFIVSLLYKATPDEVKLILIDPKKVEFGMYNGIPHLLVPVVSEPKKAAGSLAWAVNEMERRFTLIEAVGAREIKTYNKLTANDPNKEFLPQIVIIIDELADLMMTAKDDVESSICRLAQKARAAGMHLIIGTQRPSVDVITGLIKANVPSRIAFTVASQVDSRTIIDIAGAERLMGRGDMLYAPVGCMKPMRVQGSWVSESEVEAIVEYLKGEGEVEYDTNIIESIEKEALNCGEKKKGRGGQSQDSEEGFTSSSREDILASDEMIFPAIELGLESGQLSTSLLQRRLSLGYARAARILDKLTDLGFVSPFEGSKPRHMTISANEYMEIKTKFEEERQ